MSSLPSVGDGQNNLLKKIVENTYSISNASSGFNIPEYNSIYVTYYGLTNNLYQIFYKLDGLTVFTLQIDYVGGVPTTNDANLQSIYPI